MSHETKHSPVFIPEQGAAATQNPGIAWLRQIPELRSTDGLFHKLQAKAILEIKKCVLLYFIWLLEDQVLIQLCVRPNIEKFVSRVRGMDVDAGVSVDDGPATTCINTIRSTLAFLKCQCILLCVCCEFHYAMVIILNNLEREFPPSNSLAARRLLQEEQAGAQAPLCCRKFMRLNIECLNACTRNERQNTPWVPKGSNRFSF